MAAPPRPLAAIRRYCLAVCMNGQRSLVGGCLDRECPFHPYRLGEADLSLGVNLARVIRRFCLRCAMGDREAIRRCTEGRTCPVWSSRLGLSAETVRRLMSKVARSRQLPLPL